MISQVLNTAIVLLLVVLVAVPATVALARTLRQRVLRQRSERARRDRRARSDGRAPATYGSEASGRGAPIGLQHAAAQRPAGRDSTLVYRQLTDSGHTARRTKPGDRVPSRREAPPGG
jgi:hypothetical protein